MAKRILMIVTSHAELADTGTRTGFWLEELAVPYLAFIEEGSSVDICSPKGGRPPTDPKSESQAAPAVRAFLADANAASKLESTLRIADVRESYDAYFVVGGHGVMWDLAIDRDLQALLAAAHAAGKVIAAVCHGPAALVNVKLSNGAFLCKDKRVAGFSNAEEAAVGLDRVVPFALQSMLSDRGARYESGPLWGSFVVSDGKLITGQNPASSLAVAKGTLQALAS
ncbi:MAG: type 1 glutamine amidotransferase domain-containing protein [Pseudomonadota bacterium]